MIFIKFRIIKMDRKKQIERKKQIQSKKRYIEGQKKNGRRTAELKELKKELTEINYIIDYSSTSSNNISIRSSGVTSRSTSSSNPRGSGLTLVAVVAISVETKKTAFVKSNFS